MDAAADTASQEADGVAAHTQAGVPKSSVSARRRGDCVYQSDPARLGVQYFAIGHSSRCFSFVRDWVEKKIRYHLARASQRHGFGWKRWSREWLYGTLGLFHEYYVAY
jgi:hypothetical protein